jgi:hypothetical protein
MSVNRESPVDVVNAKNSFPAADSESKSMISLSRSSRLDEVAAGRNENVESGAGVAIGSKPTFRSAQLLSITISFVLLIY